MTTKYDHDLGLRHRERVRPEEFVRMYCDVLSEHVFATADGTWNELEKKIAHVANMLSYHRRLCELLEMPSDPREAVTRLEAAQEKARAACEALQQVQAVMRGLPAVPE